MNQPQTTDWDELYRRRETPWEKGVAHPALVDFLKSHGPLEGQIVVPGCGSGHDVRALSTPENQVLGIDLAPRALAKAEARPRTGNERYELADLFHLPARFDGQFDWVFEHTCFCAIDPARREEYVRAIVRLLKPEGKLLAIFFLNPDIEGDGPPHGVSTDELEEFFKSDFQLESEWLPARTHAGREGRELFRILQRRST